MKSRILHGTVWHMRAQPRYFFRYGAFYFDVALDELDEVARRIVPFSRNRLNVLSLRDADYLALDQESKSGTQAPAPRTGGAEGRTDAAALRETTSLITTPKVFGYQFNPVSFLVTRDAAGAPEAVTAEVHNTWGERHLYALERRAAARPPQSMPAGLAPTSGCPEPVAACPELVEGRAEDAGVYRSDTEKAFYVSPFIDAEGHYAFRMREAPGRLQIRIDETLPGENEPFFRAGMDLRPLAMTNANALRMLARYPFTTMKTTAAIHWQGLKLWLRGEPFRRHPRREEAERRATA
jgi:DUF1365 family protein